MLFSCVRECSGGSCYTPFSFNGGGLTALFTVRCAARESSVLHLCVLLLYSVEGVNSLLEIKVCKDFNGIGEQDCVLDVESEFSKVNLNLSTLERILVKRIDRGNLVHKNAFVDEHGFKVRISELSTGCKAALLVLHTEKWISLRECRAAVLDCIIKYCKQGKIVLGSNHVFIDEHGFTSSIDVGVDGKNFVSITELNNYFREACHVEE